jgi:hypothetical protein
VLWLRTYRSFAPSRPTNPAADPSRPQPETAPRAVEAVT